MHIYYYCASCIILSIVYLVDKFIHTALSWGKFYHHPCFSQREGEAWAGNGVTFPRPHKKGFLTVGTRDRHIIMKDNLEVTGELQEIGERRWGLSEEGQLCYYKLEARKESRSTLRISR